MRSKGFSGEIDDLMICGRPEFYNDNYLAEQ
jgi:hypothetical protein